jgi:hypothetical protein
MVKVNIGGLDAITLIDTGSTLDAITPEFAELSKQKLFKFSKSLPLQLGCKGSRSKTSFGAESQLSQYPPSQRVFKITNQPRITILNWIPPFTSLVLVKQIYESK